MKQRKYIPKFQVLGLMHLLYNIGKQNLPILFIGIPKHLLLLG